MAQCEVEFTNEQLNNNGFRGVVVSEDPDQKVCRPLFEMGVPAPFCPFKPDQKANCPLARAVRREIPIREGVRVFYDSLPALE